ncbi:hypothetical protein [Actinopolyspora saharensis]|uniref:Uncharacterized protein n=1 Tax=Actinopolyspora saharensis TaxID=995062 RepID=A0A1H1G425_9ACTN|nr:hypothetical protein [Actinopolyspora saharensis]SDR07586.1 hypothetical protein SAMN04489718_3390 [Actinopolyspora saharensis]
MAQQLSIGPSLSSDAVQERLLRPAASSLRSGRAARSRAWLSRDNIVCVLLVVGVLTAGVAMFQAMNTIGP